MRLFLIRAPAVLVLLLALAVVLPATTPALSQVTKVRSITQKSATSDCIGDPKTPLCAVETFLACGVRRDLSLCRKVGIDRLSFVRDLYDIEYVVTMELMIGKEDVPDRLRDTDWFRPGYMQIFVLVRFCPAGGVPCPQEWPDPVTFNARPMDGRWEMAGYSVGYSTEPDEGDTWPGNDKYNSKK